MPNSTGSIDMKQKSGFIMSAFLIIERLFCFLSHGFKLFLNAFIIFQSEMEEKMTAIGLQFASNAAGMPSNP